MMLTVTTVGNITINGNILLGYMQGQFWPIINTKEIYETSLLINYVNI